MNVPPSELILKLTRVSKVYGRLKALEELPGGGDCPHVRQLRLNVEKVVDKAEAISDWIVEFMPQYTLHNRTHLWNVLGYAERLAGDRIAELGALECALLIMAVFVHDLGMVASEEERIAWEDPSKDTPEAAAWQNYCAGHSLWIKHESMPVTLVDQRQKLLGQVRADYLRVTHADEAKELGGLNRIKGWLERIVGRDHGLFEHRGLEYKGALSLLATSHGQPVDWLPRRLAANEDMNLELHEVYAQEVGGGERVNWPYLSWLLRLADIMDFDASRTPPVVYEHLGINDAVSKEEWQKHLAISSVEPQKGHLGGVILKYICNRCPSPQVEKAIRDFIGWINQEIEHVSRQQELGRNFLKDRELALALPIRAEEKITVREGKYEYLDLAFHLDRDSVMELLMGEALYGDATLALRELAQNALDALHLRDLRSQLRDKLKDKGKVAEAPAVDPVGTETLEVRVTWGKDEVRGNYISITDNGTGMTRQAIEKFLTRIGKSYYKSPEFLREQKLMKDHGLTCTTISQFGIGFLSCFMLADRVEVFTKAGGYTGNGDEKARKVVIDGPHGLIAIYPNDRSMSGTEVVLWLKKGFEIVPLDREAVLRDLRKVHYDVGEHDSARKLPPKMLDPALVVATHIIWPRHAIALGQDSERIILDEDFHFRELVPIKLQEVAAKAQEWAVETGSLYGLDWDSATWTDPITGSRIRLAVPRANGKSQTFEAWLRRPNVQPGQITQTLLQSFVESALPTEGRTSMLFNGIKVPEIGSLTQELTFASGVGGFCWIDLRGNATPRLRSDRRALTLEQSESSTQACGDMLERAHKALKTTTLDSWRWLTHGVSCRTICPSLEKDLTTESPPLGLPPTPQLWCEILLQERKTDRARGRDRDIASDIVLARDRTRDRALDRALDLARDRDLSLALDLARDLALDPALDRAPELDRALDLARDRARARSITRDFARTLDRARPRDRARALDRALDSAGNPLAAYRNLAQSHLLSESFWPNLDSCLSCFALAHGNSSQYLGQLGLRGPLELDADARPLSDWLNPFAFDLIAPWTGIPLGQLRKDCAAWQHERTMRLVFMLPFLLGEDWFEGKTLNSARNFLKVPDILLWMPNPEHMGWRFDDASHTAADWSEGSLCALWEIKEGLVTYAAGLHTRESIRECGVTLDELLGSKREGG